MKAHRVLPLLGLAFASSAAFAQDTPEVMMSSALSELSQHTQLGLRIQGYVQGSTTTQVPLLTELSYARTASGSTMLEQFTYKNGVLQSRIVADGGRLWFYDALRHEYSSWNYGNGSVQNPNRAVLVVLRKLSKDQDGILAQSLIDALDVGANGSFWMQARWKPWMTLATVTSGTTTISAEMNTPYYQSLVYSVTPPGLPTNGLYRLDQMQFYSTRTRGTGSEVTEWTATINRGVVHGNATFTFNPGTARPVSIGLSQLTGGGN